MCDSTMELLPRLKQTIEDAKKKQFTQDDLKTAIANATQAILEKHKQDIETLQ